MVVPAGLDVAQICSSRPGPPADLIISADTVRRAAGGVGVPCQGVSSM